MTSFVSIGQCERIILNGDQTDIIDAMNDLAQDPDNDDGFGTIIIKADIDILDTLKIPKGIKLDLCTGCKLIVDNNVLLEIKGEINKTAVQIFETEQLNHNIKIYDQPIYPEWFGLFFHQTDKDHSNSVNQGIKENEYKTIQKAINSLAPGGEIRFNGSEYLIYEPIIINTKSLMLKGKGLYSAGGIEANDIIVGRSGLSNIFLVRKFGARFIDLNFVGYRTIKYDDDDDPGEYALPDCPNVVNAPKGICSEGNALSFLGLGDPPNDNIPDKNLDAEITNCRFVDFKNCVYAEGINLKIVDNFFGACHTGISIKNVQGDNIANTKKEVRGFIIDRNRFHSIGSSYSDNVFPSITGSACIKIRFSTANYANRIEDANGSNRFYALGYYNQITNNYADDCKTFFEGNVDRTKISNNSIFTSGDTAIKAFGGSFGVISNNIIDGSFTQNVLALYPLAPQVSDRRNFPTGHGIHVDYAHFTTIHNNQISNKRFHGIYLEHSKNSSIQSNTIMDFNRHWKVRSSGNDIRYDGNAQYPERGLYDGIHIDGHSNNIQNIVSNNVISITNQEVRGRYGIYTGNGDSWNFIKNNFILPTRLVESIRIEQ